MRSLPPFDTLPPFDALLAFDAALRHGSMTAAAAELGVTQSAVSHRIGRLEAFIGATLLERRRSGLIATAGGSALAEGLDDILGRLGDLRARCQAVRPDRRLKVGVSAALAQHWLVRRLPGFAAQPDAAGIDLVLLGQPSLARSADLDVRIGWVPVAEARSSSTQRLLFREQVFPVCHPRLLDPSAGMPAAERLATLPLLHKGRDRVEQGREWEWSTWFERLGLPGRPVAGLHVEEIGMAIAAALEGAGVALARSLLVHDAIADGRLVRLLPAELSLPSSKAHVATWPAALSGDPRVRAFVAWLAAAAEATVAAMGEPRPSA